MVCVEEVSVSALPSIYFQEPAECSLWAVRQGALSPNPLPGRGGHGSRVEPARLLDCPILFRGTELGTGAQVSLSLALSPSDLVFLDIPFFHSVRFLTS